MRLWVPHRPSLIIPKPGRAMFMLNQLIGLGVGGESYVLKNSLNIVGASNQSITRNAIASLNQTKGTWAFWMRAGTQSARNCVYASGTAGAAPGWQWEREAGNNLAGYGFASGFTCTSTTTMPDLAWHHICAAFDTSLGSSAARLHFYIDGVEVSYGTNNIGAVNIQATTDTHGYGFKNGTGFYYTGKIADIHYINGQQLTPAAFISGIGAGACIPILYAGGFGAGSYHLKFDNSDLTDDSGNGLTFTGNNGPTFSTDVAVTYDAQTKLLLHCDGADASTVFTDGSAYAHVMTVGGNAQIDTAQSKFGGASALFDGSGDFIFADGSADFAFGTGDFTVEFWVRPVSAGTFFLWDGRAASPAATEGTIYMSAGKLMFRNGNTDRITGTTTLAANVWQHVALTRSGTSTRLFLDGVQEGATYTDSTNYTCPANRPFFGIGQDSASGPFNGWLDEIRISKGVARWTANFTPPTGAYSP